MKALNIIILLSLTVLLIPSCKLDKPILPGDPGYVPAVPPGDTDTGTDQGTSSTGYYFKGTLNGTAIDWEGSDDDDGWGVGTSSSGSNDQGVYTGGLTATMSRYTAQAPMLGVEFKTYNFNYATDDVSDYFNNFVNTGQWSYAANTDYTANTKSIIVNYTDNQGKTYSSVGDQSGSSFNVASINFMAAGGGINESMKLKLTFSCTLYPTDGTGNNLALTGAEATLRLENLF